MRPEISLNSVYRPPGHPTVALANNNLIDLIYHLPNHTTLEEISTTMTLLPNSPLSNMNQPKALLQPGTQPLLRQPQTLKYIKRAQKPGKLYTNVIKSNKQIKNTIKSKWNLPTCNIPNRKLPTCNMPTSTSTRKPTYKPTNKPTIKSRTSPEPTTPSEPTHLTIFAINPSQKEYNHDAFKIKRNPTKQSVQLT